LLGEVERSSGELSFVDAEGALCERARIGYVPQEAYILNGSLRENLSFGNAGIGEERMQRALQLAGLWSDIQAMAGGLATEIGEKGVNLSGGQRQRLSLARAILHEPQLVVLDDPLSAVDPATEDYLAHHLLFGEWKNVTKVAITHRLSHLERFDKIAFLDGGQLLGVGSFAALRANCAEFRAYLEEYALTQASGHAEPQRELQASVASGEAARITEDEDREYGAVRGGVYWDYVLSLGGENKKTRPYLLALLFFAAGSGTLFPLLQKTWLAFVSNTLHGTPTALDGTWLESLAKVPITAIYIYGGLGLLVMAGALFADLFWLKRGLIAGRNIHDKMLKAILGGRMRFFDATPIGRILQRFSRDMEAIDIQLQWSFEHSMKCFAHVLITLALIVMNLPFISIFIAPVLVIYYRVQKLYRASAREAKRLDSVSRSPRYAHFKETLQGLVVIRAFGKSEWFLNEFYARLRHNQRMFYGHFMLNRWFSSRIPLIGGLVSLLTALGIVASVRSGSISPGVAGLLTVYSLSFWGVLNWGIRVWAEVEARMTSMERVKHYSKVAQEQAVVRIGHVPEEWPQRGDVHFENVHLRYAEHLPLVLKGLSFAVNAGSKAGIIGRTGSGKSTLFQALYRFSELESGRILIDGVDIATIPLARLRKALAIIPQDPTLFMGTIRSNLDRYAEFNDLELWRVLDRTSLGHYVRSLPKGLLTELSENGTNLSQGQRQLMCLARALLLNAKVIILDEATASVDVKTDVQVQRVLRESCAGVTMLIIAHRLGTVRDCDQILEISEGILRRNIQPKHREGALTV
jgi:ABC-type multidrug transport system fused ATPase/permease subunit